LTTEISPNTKKNKKIKYKIQRIKKKTYVYVYQYINILIFIAGYSNLPQKHNIKKK